jgi:hypothetical protein
LRVGTMLLCELEQIRLFVLFVITVHILNPLYTCVWEAAVMYLQIQI